MNLFRLNEVRKYYGSRLVLDIDKLEVENGSIHAIVGPNGAGKTTLLRLLGLLDEPDSGEIRFFEEFPYNSRRLEYARRISMVFQKPHMFYGTVFDNVAYGLKVRQSSKQEIKNKVAEVLDFVGLADFTKRAARKLSGGEMQRVALARALVLDPQVLLLDEPTANRDPSNVQVIEDIIKRCGEQLGTTVVIVTHNLFQAKRIANQTLLMIDGQIVENMPTEQFFSHPNDDRTRQFLNGTMIY
ncbi:MAG: phosphate ABC transporter ATP-binding protein [Candidatus Saccharibacteria bacterium]